MKTFKGFLLYIKDVRIELFIICLLLFAIGLIHLILFPAPFWCPDSPAYLKSATTDMLNVYRPMGYSNYLLFLHNICSNIKFVFCFTYFLHCLSSLFLIYSFRYLTDNKNKYVFYLLCLLAFLSPTLLFSSNYIMSDSLFTSLTLLFVATAIWMIYSKPWIFIITHLLILAALYSVRYSGMFFIPISMIAIFFAFRKYKLVFRIALCFMPFIVILFLQTNVKNDYEQYTNVRTTSGFSGWQLANNTAPLIPEAKKIPISEFKTNEIKSLHNFLVSFPDSVFSIKYSMGTSFMWEKDLPFKQFLFAYIQWSKRPYPLAWVDVSEIYTDYAKVLIFKMPIKYITHYVLPSLRSLVLYFPISEYSNPFSCDKTDEYFYGICESPATECMLYKNIDGPRQFIHYIYYTLLIGSILFLLIRMFRFNYTKNNDIVSFVLLSFCCLYIVLSLLASPNTTWRYALPLYLPSLLLFICVFHYLKRPKKV